MGDEIELSSKATWKGKKKKQPQPPTQEPQASTSSFTADIITHCAASTYTTRFIPIYIQSEPSTSSAPDPIPLPEPDPQLIPIPAPILTPDIIAEAEHELFPESDAKQLERRRTVSESRVNTLKVLRNQKTRRRRTNSESECQNMRTWPTRLMLFTITNRTKFKPVILNRPKLVVERPKPPKPKPKPENTKLLLEQSLDESVDLLNDTSISDNSVQEFRSLPNLREVRRGGGDNCRKCKRTGKKVNRKRCWEVLADWCRFPRMKCACMDTNSYERLPSVGGYLALSSYVGSGVEDKDSSTEKQEELLFYNDDNSYQSVVVERNLCASDLCQLLAVKNRVGKDVNWTIVEHWVDLGLERLLEDHEDVLSAHRDMENFSRHAEVRLVFRKEFRKYEFFHHPQQFFPPDMIDVEHCESLGNTGLYTNNPGSLMNLVTRDGECPSVFSNVWVQDPNKQIWSKGFLLLRDKKLYLSYKVQVVAKFLRTGKQKDSTYYPVSEADAGQLTVFARLSDYHVYTTLNAKNQFRAPTEWGICLRPSGTDSDPTANLDDDVDFAGSVGASKASLRCLACDSERARTCWLTAMRLAKYGKQLRENYRAFKNKQVETINPKEYNSYTVPNESVRSRVAMDFTGSVGRIVEDPKEAKAIAAAEGYSWRRRWRPSTRAQAPPHSPVTQQGIDSGVHITQPWFHSGMSRDQAAALVTRYGTVDGVFLVRDSRSNPGAFVLTYKCGGKVLHTQITPILDPVREAHVFSLDNGFTKFYDLLQLVEFYQLNAGVLPTRLTHYVVQSPTGITVPAPANNVSPSVAGSF